MANNTLRRLGLSKEDAGECLEDIESCEEEVDDTTIPGNLENSIEECEEPRHSDKGCHSRHSYQPLEVRRRRINNSVSSVNNERTYSVERKTVLYGQTPMTVRRKQLQAMAEWSGLSMKELAEKIVSRNSSENLVLLRQFHTHIEPQLSSLFEDLENSASSVPEKPGCHRGKRVERREPRAVDSRIQKDPSIQECIVRKEGCEPDETDLFSQSSTDYFNIPTVPVHLTEELGTTSNRRKQIKRTKSITSEPTNRKSCKTVVSETDSDSSEGPQSPSRLHDYENVSHHQQTVDNRRADKIMPETTPGPGLCQRSPLPTVSSNVYDPLIGTENTASVEHSKEPFHEKIGSKYYNSYLDDLLFGDNPGTCDSNPCPSSSKTVDIRNEDLNKQDTVALITQRNDATETQTNRASSSECTSTRSCDNQPVLVRRRSGCYNRVLEGLLFNDVNNPLVPHNRISEPDHGSDDRNDSQTKMHPDNPTSDKKDSTAKSIFHDFFDEPLDSSSESYKENVSPRVKKKLDNGREDDKQSKLENEESKGHPLPSSLELNNSLWHTLDASLEY